MKKYSLLLFLAISVNTGCGSNHNGHLFTGTINSSPASDLQFITQSKASWHVQGPSGMAKTETFYQGVYQKPDGTITLLPPLVFQTLPPNSVRFEMQIPAKPFSSCGLQAWGTQTEPQLGPQLAMGLGHVSITPEAGNVELDFRLIRLKSYLKPNELSQWNVQINLVDLQWGRIVDTLNLTLETLSADSSL